MIRFLPLLFLFIANSVTAQVNLVPMPASYKAGHGTFKITPQTKIILEGSNLERSAALLSQSIKKNIGFALKIEKSSAVNALLTNKIVFNFEQIDREIAGGYNLEINDKGIYLAGDNEAGIFYGIQTLMQLIPATPLAEQKRDMRLIILPQLIINDFPRFAYRGAHLDVCRHFFSVQEVKQYIDYLAAYKYNVFHWHLTEDQGWRIEIKKYPKLTSVGGFRNGTIIGNYPGTGNDSLRYGGFYTQQEIKDVVKYASERYIEIIPEIEMPGHASAAIAAYPQLSCFPDEATKVDEGTAWAGSREGKQVQQAWGVFDDVFCPSEYSFRFLQDVIDEVSLLFPSKYIHIGGDECPKTAWQRSPFCQQLIRDKNLKDEHGLQSYFIGRMEKYINSKGKKIIGWNEILEGGLAPNATVMSWQGEDGGIAAVKQGHNVIMTPEAFCYLDHSQSTNEDSITIGGFTPVEKVYSYEPVPGSVTPLQAKEVLGAQVNLWTEYISNMQKLQYMIFPRMIAFSEVLWSPKDKRNWKSFEKRLPAILDRLDATKINHSNAFYNISANVLPSASNDGVIWQVKRPASANQVIAIGYPEEKKNVTVPIADSAGTFSNKTVRLGDGYVNIESRDTVFSAKITRTGFAEAQLFSSTGPSKRWHPDQRKFISSVQQQFSFNLATGKKILVSPQPSDNYPGTGAFTLVDGVINSKGMARSSEFIGYNGKDLEAIVDLGKPVFINEIILHALEDPNSWIYAPLSVSFYSSPDSVNFKLLETVTARTGAANKSYSTRKTEPSRFVKIIAKNMGTIPDGKAGAGSPAWLFADEIEIK